MRVFLAWGAGDLAKMAYPHLRVFLGYMARGMNLADVRYLFDDEPLMRFLNIPAFAGFFIPKMKYPHLRVAQQFCFFYFCRRFVN